MDICGLCRVVWIDVFFDAKKAFGRNDFKNDSKKGLTFRVFATSTTDGFTDLLQRLRKMLRHMR